MKIIAALSLTLAASAAFAHHGSTGQFNHDIELDVSGVVTDIRFVNPHSYVYFDVTNDAGDREPWRCEMRAGSLLKRNGWTEEMLADGAEIAIHGSAARREEFGCYTSTITFADGRVIQRNETIELVTADDPVIADVQLAAGTPNINGNRNWVRARRTPGELRGGGIPYAVTELNSTETEGFNREVNPRFHCEATNIFHDWTFDEHVNTITQTDSEIELKYEFMDIVRTIPLNMDEHPSNIVASRAGYSIGKWESNTLVIETIGFLPGWLEAARVGVRHGANMHTTERYTLM